MRKKILFVDDEKVWCEIVAEYFKAFGYDVLTAKNGTEALFKGQGVTLDLIILDVNLAGENGVVFIKLFRRNHLNVPVILYTGQIHDNEQIQAMLNEGANLYLRKEVQGNDLEELLRAVRTLIG